MASRTEVTNLVGRFRSSGTNEPVVLVERISIEACNISG